MRNSSHRPGCMRRFPASHSCQPRRVQWMSAAAAVCESPAVSRAALISAGEGLAEGPFGPRFGWLLNEFSDRLVAPDRGFVEDFCTHSGASVDRVIPAEHQQIVLLAVERPAGFFSRLDELLFRGFDGVHFLLQPLFPRRGGQQRAAHELNYTRIACNGKSFFA